MLAGAIADEATATLYGGLASAEVRHRDTVLELAESVAPATWRIRLAVLARAEAEIIAKIPLRARIH
jgi:tRNA isopentenyl-2-thiomethyl-A-37 hydroxylase MiaE